MKKGDVVTTTKHNYKMTVRSVEGNSVVCNYFIEAEVQTETHNISDLTIQ